MQQKNLDNAPLAIERKRKEQHSFMMATKDQLLTFVQDLTRKEVEE
jgi:hypothetical protein